MKKGFAEVNETALYYEMVGRGHPLVLVHGWGFDTRMWDDQFEAFAKHFTAMRYDVRGFGKSALPTIGKEYSHAKDLKALLNQLGIDQTYLIGLSMGGNIALDFTLEYPEMTKALILVDSILEGFGDWSNTRLDFVKSLYKEAKVKGVKAAKDIQLKDVLLKPALEKPNVAFQLRQMVSDYSGWHFVNTDPLRPSDPPAIDRLQEIKVPTLIIVGERSLPEFHRIADILKQKIQNSKRVTLRGAGHVSCMETPREFNHAVSSFLDNI